MMNPIIKACLEALRDRKETPKTRTLAKRELEREEEKAARRAAAACTTAKVAKRAIASVEHHKKARRQEERELEEVKDETWLAVLYRSGVDHRGRVCCEACHVLENVGRIGKLEPHHLEMGSGNRTDAPHLVMALCADCHRLGRRAAHRAVRWFAETVVIPWARAHGFPLPNRKEYRA